MPPKRKTEAEAAAPAAPRLTRRQQALAEAAAAAPPEEAPAAAAEEAPETPKKVRKTTARKAPKDKKKTEEAPPPEPAPEPAPGATKDDVLGMLLPRLAVGVPEGTTEDQKLEALGASLDGLIARRPEVTYESVLLMEEVQDEIVGEATALLAPPPTPPAESGSAAAAAAAAAPPTEDALLTAARKLPTPAPTPVATPVPAPAPAPDSEAEESPLPSPPGFAPTPVAAPDASPPSSMSQTALSLSSASSMGSVDEEVEVLRLRRVKELIASEASALGASFPEYGERVVDFAELKGADTDANPIYCFELIHPAEDPSVKAIGLALFYAINTGGVRYDHVRILALGARTGEPISHISALLKRFAHAIAQKYELHIPGQAPMLNPNIIVQYVRNQAPKDKANLAATLKELTPKFAFAPYNLQGWQTGLEVPGGPIWTYDTVVTPNAAGVAGQVAYRYTSYAPAEEKTVPATSVSKVQAFNPISLKWEPSPTCVLISTTGILAEEHPLVLPTGKDAYTWTLSRAALTGTAEPPMKPLTPGLPGRADDLIRSPRGGTRRKRATSRRSS